METKKKVKKEENTSDKFIDVFYHELDGPKKSKYGIMAKRIIDIARCFYLIDQGCSIEYQRYCDFEMSPENYVIIVNNP